LRSLLTVDSVDKVGTELELIRQSYNLKSVSSLKSFISKVSSTTKDINDFNKISRIQRVRVLLNKY